MRTALKVLMSCAVVWASSHPEQTSCNVEDPQLGVTNMLWVKPAVRTNAYTVRSADGCSGDPTSYTPGALVPIHIRTLNYKRNWRGLLIYGVAQNSGARVGDWQLDWPNSNMFWKPQNGPCQNKSLMHLNAVEKYYHHVLWYVAPPAGTGPVEFHVLLKRGSANTGEFYWPNLGGNLVLQEGPATGSGDKWVQGAAGQTCTQVCASAGGCDQALLTNAFQYGSFMNRDVLYSSGCNVPAVENEYPVPYRDPFGWCYYPSVLVGANSGSCGMAAPNGTIPICPCGSAGQPSNRVTAPPATACLNEFVAMGGASHMTSSLVSIALMLLTTFWFHQPRKSSSLVLCAVLLGSAHVVQAHNWVYMVSRSFNQASTYKPCRPKVDDQPHWEINEGQSFTAEWATGHDWYFYYTVVASKDQDVLNDIEEQDLDNYVGNCTGSQDYMRQLTSIPQNWTKQHIGSMGDQISIVGLLDNLPIYERNISTNDPLYIPRHEKFDTITDVRFLYTSQNTDLDLRCGYYSSYYPALIAVHRFVQVQTALSRAGERDIARFTINLDTNQKNAGYGEGAYIVQYLWRGYFDCIDVDLFEPPTYVQEDLIGGRKILANEPQWNKVDHCLFEEIQNRETGCREVITTAQGILDDCLQNGCCGGVNVVPLWLPNEVFPLFSNRVSIPWNDPNGMGFGGCDKGQFDTLPMGAMIGYGVQPRPPNSTFASYSVTDDPEDPLFYSTCYIKKPQWVFDLQLPNVNQTQIYIPPPWAYSDRCVDCEQWLMAQDTKFVPHWSPMPQHCRNCALDTLPPVSTALSVVSKGQICDGSWGGQTWWLYGAPDKKCDKVRCTKELQLAGWYQTSADECVALAQRDPDCGDVVEHGGEQNGNVENWLCRCWLKTNPTCCGTCKPVDWSFSAYQYNILSTATTNVGDPTCSTGVKSADGVNCCPKSCGICPSKPLLKVSFQSAALVAPFGWAVDNGYKKGARNNTYSQALNNYGWTCDLSSQSYDRCVDRGDKNPDCLSYRSTSIQADFKTCGATPAWSVDVGADSNFQAYILYSQPFANYKGCTLDGDAAYVQYHDSLGCDDIAWAVVNTTSKSGQITWSGDNDNACDSISAMLIFPAAGVPPNDCQYLNGTCCPHFLPMDERPCASFPPPCLL